MTTDPTSRPSDIPWPPLLLLTALVAAWLLGRAWPLPWPGLDDLPARVIGYGVGLAGIALAAWAIVTLARAGTTVRPDRGSDTLVTTGPYARWRNPIYLADAMILLGLAELSHNIWLAILTPVFAAAVTWLAILPEERHLETRFGDAYLAYKTRARRWL